MGIDIKPKDHLINIIKDTRDHHPNFTLLLGAGASKTSSVHTSKEMISEWRAKYKIQNQGADANDIEKQPWFNRPEEYSALFEYLYDQPSQRREYIESCLKDAKPSWGYIYLVNLLKDVFNTVFTTNFDDLLNEACYLFSSNVRPLVCAHDSSVKSLRITSQRPKIIKLHGDFLFDDIKNTARELESLETNMRDKFRQYAPEYGMIVVGYAGNDRSVMDNINTLLRSDTNYPHGVYWCIRRDEDVSDAVQNLTRFPNFHLVRIQGFDELFAEINDALELNLQPEMIDPYEALTKRLNALLENAAVPDDPEKIHPVIKRDVERLTDRIKNDSTGINQKGETDTIAIKADGLTTNPPYQLLADSSYRSGNFNDAKHFIKLKIENDPDSSAYRLAIKLLAREWDEDFAQFIFDSLGRNFDSFDFNGSINTVVALIGIEKYDLANQILDAAGKSLKKMQAYPAWYSDFHIINKAQILRHQGVSLPEEVENEIQNVLHTSDPITQMGCYLVLGDFDKAITILEEKAEEHIMEWPILKLFPAKYKEQLGEIKKRFN